MKHTELVPLDLRYFSGGDDAELSRCRAAIHKEPQLFAILHEQDVSVGGLQQRLRYFASRQHSREPITDAAILAPARSLISGTRKTQREVAHMACALPEYFWVAAPPTDPNESVMGLDDAAREWIDEFRSPVNSPSLVRDLRHMPSEAIQQQLHDVANGHAYRHVRRYGFLLDDEKFRSVECLHVVSEMGAGLVALTAGLYVSQVRPDVHVSHTMLLPLGFDGDEQVAIGDARVAADDEGIALQPKPKKTKTKFNHFQQAVETGEWAYGLEPSLRFSLKKGHDIRIVVPKDLRDVQQSSSSQDRVGQAETMHKYLAGLQTTLDQIDTAGEQTRLFEAPVSVEAMLRYRHIRVAMARAVFDADTPRSNSDYS